MDPVVSRALAGYAKTAAAAPRLPEARPDAKVGEDFASFFREIATQSIATLHESERASIQGMQGKLDAQSVVEALAAAELTVQAVTAVRDRVVEAYQELIRMPI